MNQRDLALLRVAVRLAYRGKEITRKQYQDILRAIARSEKQSTRQSDDRLEAIKEILVEGPKAAAAAVGTLEAYR